MTDVARTPADEPRRAPASRPPLEAVRDIPETADASPTAGSGEPNVGRNAVLGYVIGFLAVTVAITVAGTLGGLGFVASLGLGTFVGAWGGGGFGFMVGGTVPFARHLDARSAHPTDRSTTR